VQIAPTELVVVVGVFVIVTEVFDILCICLFEKKSAMRSEPIMPIFWAILNVS
jgi:hypothetical protein